MSLLCDSHDPTTALFLSVPAAARAADMVMRQHSRTVSHMNTTLRRRKGEPLGYALNIHFRDGRTPSPLTNSDFERLTRTEAAR